VDQRHVAAPRLHKAAQIGLRLVLAAAFAPDEQRDVARSQRRPWRRQAMRSLRLNYLNAFAI
jgi:hypothetical protein